MKAQDLYRFIKETPTIFDGGHDIYTPQPVVEQLINNIDIDCTNSFLVMFNIEFVISLVYNKQVDPTKITFYSDHANKTKMVKKIGVNCITNLETDMKFDVVIINPPFTLCKEFREIGKNLSNRYVWMITKTDHMDQVDRFDDVVYFKHLGDKAFKEQILTCSFLIDKKKKPGSAITIEDVAGQSVQKTNIVLPPGPELTDWEYASKVLALDLKTYSAGGGYVGQSEAKKVTTNGIKCIWRCGRVGGDFEWDLIDQSHKEQVYGLGKHKIIVSKMTSIGNLGDVKYADPTFGVGSTCYRVDLDSKEDCEQAIEYLNSPQVKRLVRGIKTMTASSSNKIWSKIPHHSEKDKWFSIT